MRLYRIELYKLISRKIFIVGAICVITIMLFFFMADVSEERSCVDGITYTGYRAVQVNRQITEEFKGVLTDEKAEQIIDKYSFPQEVKPDYGFMDANFLNRFVMDYLSDGYIRDWDNYKIATCVYLIADSDLGTVRKVTEKEIVLEYYQGWKVFLEILSVGMVLGSILILFSISTVFANESQVKMLQLLFTTEEGRKKDIFAKIAAAFTVALSVWLVAAVLDFLLCGVVYGFEGLNCVAGLVTGGHYFSPGSSASLISCGTYIEITLLLSLLGILSLCAITICLSACSGSSFHAVVTAAVCWGAPMLLRLFFEHGFIILFASPFFLVYREILSDVYNIWQALVWTALAVSCVCTIGAYREYEKRQVL